MRKARKGKQKGRRQWKKAKAKVEVEGTEPNGDGRRRLFGCYLLTSLNPRHKGSTYIGFTVNPKRRIRQHNGEITSGTSKTKKKRPWEMVLCIHGFPSDVTALQFEWAWQHPRDSIAVRETAASFKTLGGLANKIKLALTMLTLPSWQCMDLTVSFFSTNYMKHAADSPSLPPQMKLHFSSLDDLPCYSHPNSLFASDHDDDDDNDNDDVDVHFSSFDKTLESGLIDNNRSIDGQSCTLEYSPEQTTCNQDTTAGTLDEDAIYLNAARPDEQLPPHQFPTNVSASDVDLLQPSSSLGENVTSFGGNNFANTKLPILKKHMYPCHHHLNDYTSPSKEEPFPEADASVRDQPSTFDYLSVTNTCIFIDESPEEKRQAMGRTRTSCVDIVHGSSTHAIEPVEVIDLYTSPPGRRIMAGRKKRRILGDFSNFIDLTNSRLFLEL